MRYRLRTLLIVLALGPPLLAGAWWNWLAYSDYRKQKAERDEMDQVMNQVIAEILASGGVSSIDETGLPAELQPPQVPTNAAPQATEDRDGTLHDHF